MPLEQLVIRFFFLSLTLLIVLIDTFINLLVTDKGKGSTLIFRGAVPRKSFASADCIRRIAYSLSVTQSADANPFWGTAFSKGVMFHLSPISQNLTEIKCICKLDVGKVLWNWLYLVNSKCNYINVLLRTSY